MSEVVERRPLWLGNAPTTIEETDGEKETVQGGSDVQELADGVDRSSGVAKKAVSVPPMRPLAPGALKEMVERAVYQQLEALKEELYSAGVLDRPPEEIPQESTLVKKLRTELESFQALHDFNEVLRHFREDYRLVASAGSSRAVLSLAPKIVDIRVHGEVSKRETYVFEITLQGDSYNDPIRAARLLREIFGLVNGN